MTDAYPAHPSGKAEPGDTISYTADISNATGSADATGVNFDVALDPNTTFVLGSLKVSPLAFPDAYTVLQNTTLNTPAATGVLLNDTGSPAPTAVPIAGGAPNTTAGGTVTLNADGSFTYNPPSAAFTGPDTFTYTAINGQAPPNVTDAQALVTITVNSPNAAPVANNDTASATEAGGTANGTPGTNPSGNLVTGVGAGSVADTDAEDASSALTVVQVHTGPEGGSTGTGTVGSPLAGTYGTLTLNSNGSYTYTVNNNNATVQALRTSLDTIQDVFNYTIQDTGPGPQQDTAQFTVTIAGANDAPTDIAITASSVPENSAINTVVGDFSTTDLDTGDTFTYTLVAGAGSTNNASFNISGTQLRTSASFNFENTPSFSIRVRSTDAGGLFFEKVFTITVTNVNEAPTDIALSANTIGENLPINTVIGNFSTTDPDAGDTFTYTLVAGAGSTDNGSFNINGNQLQSSAVFDFETKSSYSIRVRSTDAGSLNFEKVFTITIVNNNDAPTDIALSNSSVAENSAINTVVGNFSTTDQDVGNTFTYTLVAGAGSTDNASFNINGAQLRTSAVFDFETKSSYTIRVRSTDNAAAFFEKQFTITVTDVPEAPVLVTSGGSASFTEDGPPVVVDPGITVADQDSATLASGIIQITGNLQTAEDVLAFTNDGSTMGNIAVSVAYNPATGLLTLASAGNTATLLQWQSALRAVTYNNTSQNPNTTARTVSFRVNDGALNSNLATRGVTVTAVNDAPVLAAIEGGVLAYTENDLATAITSTITVNDVDNATLTSGTVSITSNFLSGQDVLSFVNVPATMGNIAGVYTPGTGVMALTSAGATATLAQWQAALRAVKYNNSSDDPSTLTRTVTFQVNDAGAVNNLSNTQTRNITITAVNDPPTANGFAGLPAQAGIPITYPAAKLGGTDVEAGTTITIDTTPINVTNGTVVINANGSFTFTPLPNATTGSFQYRVSDNGNPAPGVNSAYATVSFTVAGPAIYFVKNPAVGLANCTLGNECLLATAVTNIGASTNARIFIEDANSHAGTVPLNSGGWLIGQGVTGPTFDTFFGILAPAQGTLAARPSLAGTRPTVQNTVTLNTNSTVRGLNISSTTNTGMADPVAAITGVSVSELGVTTSSGTGVLLSNIAGTLTFDNLTTTSGTGADLTGSNSSATFNFNGVSIVSGVNPGFAATGGGTVNITGASNSINSVGGTALNITNTNIGASHLTFHDISSGNNNATADPANGIILNATGATGHLTITGDGNTSVGGNSSGGVIQHTTSHGISLTNTLSPSFTNMSIHDIARNGINGTGVTNFTFDNGQITNTGTGVVDQYNESAIAFVDPAVLANTVSGNVIITDSLFSGARRNAIMLETWNGTISNVNISNNTLSGPSLVAALKDATLATTADIQDAIHVFSQGSASTTANLTTGTINSNTISGFEFLSGGIFIGGNGIRVAGGSGNAGNATVGTLGAAGTPIEIGGNDVDNVGSNAIAVSFNGVNGLSNFNIHNNGTVANPMSNAEGLGISVFFGGSGTFSALVNNNAVNNNGPTVNAGSAGIAVQADDGPAALANSTGVSTIHVNNNTITNPDGFGIRGIARASICTLNLYVQNNDVGTPRATNREAIRIDSGSAAGDTTLNLNMTGNSGPLVSTTDLLVGAGIDAGIGVRKQGTVAGTNEFNIQGIAAAPTNAQVQAYLGSPVPPGKNYTAAAGGAAGTNANGNGVDIISGSNYGTTNAVPLLLAPGGVERVNDWPSVVTTDVPSLFDSSMLDDNRAYAFLPTVPASVSTSLTQQQLDAMVGASINRWIAAGLTPRQIGELRRLKFEIADLPGECLGEANGRRILVDRNAGSKGWFVDPNPLSDASFARAVSTTRLYTDPWSVPAGHVDLLTAIEHEMGHKLGLSDSYDEKDRDNLMYGHLTVGERRLPAKGQAKNAEVGSSSGSHFLSLARSERSQRFANYARSKQKTPVAHALTRTSSMLPVAPPFPVSIGTIPAGKSVRVTFQVTLNTLSPPSTTQVSAQGTVSGTNFSNVLTDDTGIGANAGETDPTVTPVIGPPIANDDPSYNAFKNTPLNIAAPGVLANDSVNTGAITSYGVAGTEQTTIGNPTPTAQGGTISLNANGSFTYTPALAFIGTDTFIYKLTNTAVGGTDTATVTITVADASAIYINEVLFNPPGTDAPNEYVELRGPASTVIPAGTYFVAIEGDAADNPGDVQTIINLSGLSFGSNGFLVLLQNGNTYTTAAGATVVTSTTTGFGGLPGSRWSADAAATDIEDSSVTFMLIQTGVAPTLTDDIDSNDDGSFDGSVYPGWSVRDSISAMNGSALARAYGAFSFRNTAGTGTGQGGEVIVPFIPSYVGRVCDSTGSTAADWVSSGVLGGAAPNWTLGSAAETEPASFAGKLLNHIGASNFANLAPTNTVPGAQATNEDVALVFTGANQISIADPDAGSADVKVTLTAVNGTFSLGGIAGLSFTTGDGTNDTQMVFTGTIANINTALNNLTFTPPANFFSPPDATLTILTEDQGNTGCGGNQTDSDVINITVGSVNDPPSFTLSGNPPSVNEDAGAQTVNSLATSISQGPGESGQTLTFNVSPTGTTGNIAFSSGPAIDATTGALTYTTSANTNGTATFNVTLSDNGGGTNTSAPQPFTITVNAVNDAPTFQIPSNPPAVNEDAPAQTVNSFATNFLPGPVTATDEAGQTLVGYTVTANGTTGNLTFTSGPSINNAGQLTYTPTANTSGTATFNVVATDSGSGIAPNVNQSAAVSFTITVTGQNDAPVLDNTGNMTLVAINEDVPNASNPGTLVSDIILSAGGDRITDVDSGAVEGIAVTAVDNTNGAWQFSIDNGTNWTAFGSPNGTTARLLASNATTRVRFIPNLNFNGTVDPGLTFRAWDQTSGVNGNTADTTVNGGTTAFSTATETASITVSSVNDNPTTSGLAAVNVNEDAPDTLINLAANFNDVEDGGTGLTYTVQANTNPALFSSTLINNATHTLTLDYAPNANGVAQITVRGTDTGGLFVESTFTVTVNAINDPPSFTKGADQTLNEDAGAQTVAGWATSISQGPGESGQTLTFNVSVNSTTGNLAFSSAPVVNSSTGTLTYTTSANTNGTATINVSLSDNGSNTAPNSNTSAVQQFTITVNAVNDAPTFQIVSNPAAVNEDAGAQTINSFATNFQPGPATATDEVGQTLVGYTVTQTGTTGGLTFTSGPSINNAGQLTYTPAANASGTATFDVVATDSGSGTAPNVNQSVAVSFTITVNAVNDAPVLDNTGNMTLTAINEDVANASNPGTLVSDIILSAGGDRITDVDSGAVEGIAVTAANNTNGTWQFSIDNGTNWTAFGSPDALNSRLLAANALTRVRFIPNLNFNGTVDPGLTFRAWDQTSGVNGNTADTSVNGNTTAFSTAIETASITVNPVNDSPTADSQSTSTNEDIPTAITLTGSDTETAAGSLTFVVTVLPSHGVLSGTGANRTYTPAVNYNGPDSFKFTVTDTGDGSSPALTSAEATVSITVNAVNDAPSFTRGPDQTIQDPNPQSIPNWATNISAGPADEAGQTLTFLVSNNSNVLFSAQPAISPNGTLTFTAAAGQDGVATVTVRLQDNGGTALGGVDTSAPQTFTITVHALNNAPTLNALSNLVINEDASLQTVNLAGITTGASFESAQTLTVTATSSNPALIPNPSVTYTNPDTTGSISFTPLPDANGSVVITVTVKDNGGTANGGIDTFVRTFTVTVNAVNDAPVNHVPGAQTGVLNTSLVFSTATSNLISISDVDAGSDPVQVTLKATDGTLTLSSTSGLSFSAGDGTDDALMTFTGTIANINLALNGMRNLTFGTGVITITTNDLGRNGSGGPLSDTDTIAVTVNDTQAPLLLTVEGTDRAIALDSVTLLRDPFGSLNDHNFSSDHRTRIALFALHAQLLPGETAAAVTAEAQDLGGNVFPLTVESVRTVPGFDWLTQVVVKLPEFMQGGGGPQDIKVRIRVHGQNSNQAVFTFVPGP
jgi:VCBS repeat-containing protein